MSTPNAAANNKRALDFGTDFANSTLEIRDGTTVLATHTVPSWGTPNNGVTTAASISDAVMSATGTADGARLIKDSKIYDLTLGVSGSGAEVIVSTVDFVQNDTSQITSCTATFS